MSLEISNRESSWLFRDSGGFGEADLTDGSLMNKRKRSGIDQWPMRFQPIPGLAKRRHAAYVHASFFRGTQPRHPAEII